MSSVFEDTVLIDLTIDGERYGVRVFAPKTKQEAEYIADRLGNQVFATLMEHWKGKFGDELD